MNLFKEAEETFSDDKIRLKTMICGSPKMNNKHNFDKQTLLLRAHHNDDVLQ